MNPTPPPNQQQQLAGNNNPFAPNNNNLYGGNNGGGGSGGGYYGYANNYYQPSPVANGNSAYPNANDPYYAAYYAASGYNPYYPQPSLPQQPFMWGWQQQQPSSSSKKKHHKKHSKKDHDSRHQRQDGNARSPDNDDGENDDDDNQDGDDGNNNLPQIITPNQCEHDHFVDTLSGMLAEYLRQLGRSCADTVYQKFVADATAEHADQLNSACVTAYAQHVAVKLIVNMCKIGSNGMAPAAIAAAIGTSVPNLPRLFMSALQFTTANTFTNNERYMEIPFNVTIGSSQRTVFVTQGEGDNATAIPLDVFCLQVYQSMIMHPNAPIGIVDQSGDLVYAIPSKRLAGIPVQKGTSLLFDNTSLFLRNPLKNAILDKLSECAQRYGPKGFLDDLEAAQCDEVFRSSGSQNNVHLLRAMDDAVTEIVKTKVRDERKRITQSVKDEINRLSSQNMQMMAYMAWTQQLNTSSSSTSTNATANANNGTITSNNMMGGGFNPYFNPYYAYTQPGGGGNNGFYSPFQPYPPSQQHSKRGKHKHGRRHRRRHDSESSSSGESNSSGSRSSSSTS